MTQYDFGEKKKKRKMKVVRGEEMRGGGCKEGYQRERMDFMRGE